MSQKVSLQGTKLGLVETAFPPDSIVSGLELHGGCNAVYQEICLKRNDQCKTLNAKHQSARLKPSQDRWNGSKEWFSKNGEKRGWECPGGLER